MHVGYIRVSSSDQNPERQRVELEQVGAEKFFEDHLSGASTDRPQFQELMKFVREGDTISVLSLDRLSRSLADLLHTVDALGKRGVSVHFLSEHLNFDAGKDAPPASKLMLSMVGAFAEFERSIIRQRQREGIALAKARGAYQGRPRSVTDEQIESIKKKIEMGVPLTVAAKQHGISRATVYRYLPGGSEKRT